MGFYKNMVMSAKENGVANETMMWKEIDHYDELLEEVKEAHPDIYWEYIRKAHESINGKHFDESFARYTVDNLHYTDKDGIKRHGARWSPEEVSLATSGKNHPRGVTEWDKWVAYNAMYADLSKSFDDEQILNAAFLFYFADEDWSDEGCSTKVWEYMNR